MAVKAKRVFEPLDPVSQKNAMKTLWEAELAFREGGRHQHMLFRSGEDFTEAAQTAQTLLEGSTGAKVSGATIISVKRVARLMN